MPSALTVLGLLAVPALGVKLAKSYVDANKDSEAQIATKLATVYGGLAVASYAVGAMTSSGGMLADFAKGGMYGAGGIGGIALGARLFGFDSAGKVDPNVKKAAGIQGMLPARAPATVGGMPAWAAGMV